MSAPCGGHAGRPLEMASLRYRTRDSISWGTESQGFGYGGRLGVAGSNFPTKEKYELNTSCSQQMPKLKEFREYQANSRALENGGGAKPVALRPGTASVWIVLGATNQSFAGFGRGTPALPEADCLRAS